MPGSQKANATSTNEAFSTLHPIILKHGFLLLDLQSLIQYDKNTDRAVTVKIMMCKKDQSRKFTDMFMLYLLAVAL